MTNPTVALVVIGVLAVAMFVLLGLILWSAKR
jgi:hypothetical protein